MTTEEDRKWWRLRQKIERSFYRYVCKVGDFSNMKRIESYQFCLVAIGEDIERLVRYHFGNLSNIRKIKIDNSFPFGPHDTSDGNNQISFSYDSFSRGSLYGGRGHPCAFPPSRGASWKEYKKHCRKRLNQASCKKEQNERARIKFSAIPDSIDSKAFWQSMAIAGAVSGSNN